MAKSLDKGSAALIALRCEEDLPSATHGKLQRLHLDERPARGVTEHVLVPARANKSPWRIEVPTLEVRTSPNLGGLVQALQLRPLCLCILPPTATGFAFDAPVLASFPSTAAGFAFNAGMTATSLAATASEAAALLPILAFFPPAQRRLPLRRYDVCGTRP